MKLHKSLCLLLALFTLLAVLPAAAAADSEFPIRSAADFAAMPADGRCRLMCDIRIDTTYPTPFTGEFDGNGHTVTTSVPLFDALGGSVHDLTIAGAVTVTGSSTPAGALAARGLSGSVITVERVTNNAPVTAEYRTGGLVGFIEGSATTATFTDCVNSGRISAGNMVGGILGYMQRSTLTLTGCVNLGKVFTETSRVIAGTSTTLKGVAGGIVGRFGSDKAYSDSVRLTITGCTNHGEVYGTTDVGGVIGLIRGANVSISDCTNTGRVAAKSDEAAGIVGCAGDTYTDSAGTTQKALARSVIRGCVNRGEIINETGSSGTACAAGIIGYVYGSGSNGLAEVYDCKNTGAIRSHRFSSEIFGYSNNNLTVIRDCVGTGPITGQYTVLIGMSSADATAYTVSGVTLTRATKYFSYAASDANSKNRVPLADYRAAAGNADKITLANEFMYGDADGSSDVTALDLASLRRYVADYDYVTNRSAAAVTDGADCDGNYSINARDLVLLRKYLAAYDPKTRRSTVSLGSAEYQFYAQNYGAGRVNEALPAGVTALISCCEYYNDTMKATTAAGQKWVYSNSSTYVPQKGSFDDMVKSGKTGTNCALPSNWALFDMGVLPSNLRFYGGSSGEFAHRSTVEPYLSPVLTITDYSGQGMTFKKLYNAGLVKAGDIFLCKGHTFIYRGDETFYAAGHDGKWHTDSTAKTEDSRKAVFEEWVCPFSSCSDYSYTICFQLRLREDYVPEYYRNAYGELVPNPMCTEKNPNAYSYDAGGRTNVLAGATFAKSDSFNLGKLADPARLTDGQLYYDNSTATYSDISISGGSAYAAAPTYWFDANGNKSTTRDATHKYLGGFRTDLGKTVTVDSFSLWSQAIGATSGQSIGDIDGFDILVSTDGKNWTVVYSIEKASCEGCWTKVTDPNNYSGGVPMTHYIDEDFPEGPVVARYIMFALTECRCVHAEGGEKYGYTNLTTSNYFRISEFQVYAAE